MKKFILCILLCILVSPIHAGFLIGSYEQLAHKCYKNSQGLWKCVSENWIHMNTEDFCPQIKFGIAVAQGKYPIIEFRINDFFAETSLGRVLNDITTLDEYQQYSRSCSFSLCFSDGEVFTCSGFLQDDRKIYYRGHDKGAALLYASMSRIHSNKMNLNNLSADSQINYISKRLSTKKIEKITFAGLNFALSNVLTAEILSTFFTELYKKTGDKILYHADD